ncbi:MAG: DUF4416 family protein [Nitrospirae bacterium]|nr:DUF4416 family protein [Nitrospirota bacterium]
MGLIRPPEKAKLFTALLGKNKDVFYQVREKLSSNFGPIEFTSPIYNWSHSKYYEKEMGTELQRVFFFFEQPIEQEMLSDVKIMTNEIENLYMNNAGPGNPQRQVNIDPGYLTLAKVVLASTKDYSHRIYIGKGIYAEPTFRYINKTFQPLQTTYPDYRSKEYVAMFNEVRKKLIGKKAED